MFVQQPRDARGRYPRRRRGMGSVVFAVFFLGGLAAMVFLGEKPVEILGLYVGASVVALLAYARDKSAARNNRWRTPENTLHMIGLIGGWPGALAAQGLFRHKTTKKSFQFVFWVTVLANVGALGWWLSQPGSEFWPF